MKKASLYFKVVLILAFTVLSLVVVLFTASNSILRIGVEKSEGQFCVQNTQRALSVLADYYISLDAKLSDWASWDDAYAFINNSSPDFVKSNLVSATLTNLGINFIIFNNSNHEMALAKYVNLETGLEEAVPQDLTDYLTAHHSSLHPPEGQDSVTGLFMAGDRPVIIASRYILKSNGEGPSHGTMVMGRYLDSGLIERFNNSTHLSLSFEPFYSSNLPSEYQQAVSSITPTNPVAINRLNNNTIAGYSVINDIGDGPSVILRAEMPRDEYRRLLADTNNFTGLLLILGLIVGAVCLYLLRKYVILPLTLLSKQVTDVSANGDLSARVSVKCTDELAVLCSEINSMMSSLESAENARKKGAEQWRMLIENLGEGVLIVDLVRKITFANPTALEIFGKPEEDLIGHRFNEFLDDSSNEVARSGFNKFMTDGRARFEVELTRGLNDSRTVLVTVSKLEDKNHQCFGFLQVIRDITEHKMTEGLKATLEAKNDFISMVSHELKTPLVPIIGFADLLLQDAFGTLPEDSKGPLKTIKERADKLNTLIEDLLTVSRIERGVFKVNVFSFPLYGFLQDIVRTYRDVRHLKEESLSIDGDDFEIVADPERFRQVVQNLIDNAIKYTDNILEIKLKTEVIDGMGVLTVSDKGMGIPEEHCRYIFDRFYQVERLNTRKHEGVGLGLAITHELVDLMGGTIEVSSEVGVGTVFTVRMPLAAVAKTSDTDADNVIKIEEFGLESDPSAIKVIEDAVGSLNEISTPIPIESPNQE
jgi:PAS domain S-box-containing protein